jgi:GAF domain-containing protein
VPEIAQALAEPGRLAALRHADLLDTPAEESFDRLARVAAKVVGAPVALVTAVDRDRQFFKSCLGLPEPWATRRETPLSHSFCQHAVAAREPVIVTDAREDSRFNDNLAIRDLGVIAYLGVPLITTDGQALGTLCVIDHEPRIWTQDEIRLVTDIAAAVVTEITVRTARRDQPGKLTLPS